MLFSLHTTDAAHVHPSSNDKEDIDGCYMKFLLSATSGRGTDLGDRKELHAHLMEIPQLHWDMKHKFMGLGRVGVLSHLL